MIMGDCGLLCCVFWYFVGRLVVRYSISEEFASFTVSCMGMDGSDKEKLGPGN